ncbi:hypothetical protein CBF34_07825 [Vagococcus penaei]|uniref:Uncharacterized protein n=1 Tax=Vagococcus penaei TaxID=633807 RepID=A0A1Q2D4M6_9ENTE|nr:YdcF family protein [Vagococcus penaei]AQP53197.1 hypothetical protein BW732_02410 [Vagococcus penaei]RSU00999.1 hypothetical protein CBF34_07825 [Vagococcus penaei]
MSLLIYQLFFLLFIPLLFFGYWVYYRPTSLWTGFFFLILIGGLYLSLVLQVEQISQIWALILAIPIVLLLIAVAFFGIFAVVIMLFWNEGVLLKREGLSLANLLPALLSIALIAFQVLIGYIAFSSHNNIVKSFASFLTTVFVYMVFVFFMYALTSIVYNKFPLHKPVDYIVILGAGLINGERVTPLLASRIDAGLKLYDKQVAKLNHHPTIILSGGQGADEKVSEAQAMMDYVMSQEKTIEKIYLEEESKNTWENIKLSKAIISRNDDIMDTSNVSIVIASNNYHVLRAGKIAARQGILARAVGSKTRLYYLPTAFIREYIGYLQMTRNRHLIIIGLIFAISFVMPVVLNMLIK